MKKTKFCQFLLIKADILSVSGRTCWLWRLCWTHGAQTSGWNSRHDRGEGAEGCLQRGKERRDFFNAIFSFNTNKYFLFLVMCLFPIFSSILMVTARLALQNSERPWKNFWDSRYRAALVPVAFHPSLSSLSAFKPLCHRSSHYHTNLTFLGWTQRTGGNTARHWHQRRWTCRLWR